MPLCPECHHRPSARFVPSAYGAECRCRCHDVADAAPALLLACKAGAEFMRLIGSPAPPAPWRQLMRAIALAEPKEPTDA